MHQFKIGDKALLMPRIASGKWREVTIASEPFFSGYRYCTHDGRILAPDWCCQLQPLPEFGEHGPLGVQVQTKRLIPLPKNGPDADVTIARKLVEMHSPE